MKRFVVILMAVLVFFCVIVVKVAMAEEIKGTIRAVAYCNPQEKKSEIKFFIDTGQEMIPLKEAPPAKVGQKVLMKGRWTVGKKNDEFICRTVSPMKIKEIQTETSDTAREIKYLILLLKFSDTTTSDPDDWGTAKAEGIVFDNSDSANYFYQESSYEKVSLSGKAMDWRTMPEPTTGYDFRLDGADYQKLLNDAISASEVDAETLRGYDGVILAFAGNEETNDGYLGGGNATVGKWNVKVDGEEISLSAVWINSDIFRYSASSCTGCLFLLFHEIGHNFGWYHSASWIPPENQECRYCEDLVDVVSGNDYCEIDDYGDTENIMGGDLAQPDGLRKRDAGWLKENQVLRVLSDTTVELDQRELQSDGKKLIIIPCGYNEEEEMFYYIEYVKSSLSDFKTAWVDEIDGIALRLWTGKGQGDYNNKSIMFLTGELESYQKKINYFTENDVFCDEKRGIKIEFIEKYGEGADSKVRVKITFTCPEETSPAVSVYSEQMAIVAGQSLTAHVFVQNTMAVGCGTHTYSLKAELPENWTADFDKSSLDISPNGTETARVLVSAPTDASGSYELKFTATDATDGSLALTVEGILNVLVMPPPPSPPPLPSPTPEITPSPSPYPTPTEPATADVSKLNVYLPPNNAVLKTLILRKGKSVRVSVEALAEDSFGDIPVPNVAVKARVIGKNARRMINISPPTVLTDKNGMAEFTITATAKGSGKIFFRSQNARKILKVKIK